MNTITVDEAEDIFYGDHVAVQAIAKHRWYTKRLVVFEREGELWGFYYLDPATEMQEGQDRFEMVPVPVVRVRSREVTSIVYEAVYA